MTNRSETIEKACEVMHNAYEQAAEGAGWETNPASRKPWCDVPAANRATMRAAVAALLDHLYGEVHAAASELDALTGLSQGDDHAKADEIMQSVAHPEVSAAYDRLVERSSGWWFE
jgi:hypothetical protein